MSVRVRFAPSPTGFLHLGGVRTALINYLFAKNKKGVFVLRIEDTDLSRGCENFLKSQLEDLKWLGLNWDEGVDAHTLADKGNYGPYRQSKRKKVYLKYAEELVEKGRAYYCFLSPEEIEARKQKAENKKDKFRLKSPYRDQSLEESKRRLKAGEKSVIRFKVPEQKKTYILKDIVRGDVCFPSDMVGDFVLLRSSGLPVYNFACAVDDHAMNISHCFRSEEHLANTLRQLMIFDAFDWSPPVYGHLSIILGEDRKKLSKRHGAVSCYEYKKQAYLPSAILNFLALMGWNSKTEKEFFSLSDLVSVFSLSGLNSSPGIFDSKKLDWLNSKHLKVMDNGDIWKIAKHFISSKYHSALEDKNEMNNIIQAFKESFSSLKQIQGFFKILFQENFEIQADKVQEILKWSSTFFVLKEWNFFLQSQDTERVDQEIFLQACKNIGQKTQTKGKMLFMPIRVAVLGQPQGMELKVIVPLIQRSVLIERVYFVQKFYSSHT